MRCVFIPFLDALGIPIARLYSPYTGWLYAGGSLDSGNHDARAALVKPPLPRFPDGQRTTRGYNTPCYGEVETCNWNAECVKKWDEGHSGI